MQPTARLDTQPLDGIESLGRGGVWQEGLAKVLCVPGLTHPAGSLNVHVHPKCIQLDMVSDPPARLGTQKNPWVASEPSLATLVSEL